MNIGTMARGEYEVWQATGRRARICPTPHAIDGILWDSNEGKQVCPMCWNPSHFVKYEDRIELVLKSRSISSEDKRTFLEKELARFTQKSTGEPPMIEESYVQFLRKKLDIFDTDFPQLELF